MFIDSILLEKEHSTAQLIVDKRTVDSWIGNDPTISIREVSGLVEQLVFILTSYLVKQETQIVKVAEQSVTVTASVSVPDTLWDWLKYNYVPLKCQKINWLKPRLKTKSETKTEAYKAIASIEVLYPKLKLAFPKEHHTVRCAQINWVKED
jgi:hypothetical protein